MADQIIITGQTLSFFETRCCRRIEIGTQFLKWIVPACAVLLVTWLVLIAIGDPTSRVTLVLALSTGSGTLALAVLTFLIYRMRRQAYEALRLIENIRERHQ